MGRTQLWALILIPLCALAVLAVPASADTVRLRRMDAESQQYGFVDEHLNWAIPANYDDADAFDGGLATVCQGVGPEAKWGCIDRAGNVVIPLKYRWPVRFHDGLACECLAGEAESPCGYIDRDGKTVIAFHLKTGGMFGNGLAFVRDGDWCGYIDRTGQRKIPLEQDQTGEAFHEGMACVESKGPSRKRKFIDADGKTLFTSPQRLGAFASARCIVVDDSQSPPQYGFVDRDGHAAIQAKYQEARPYSATLAAVKLNGAWQFIDTSGNVLGDLKFDEVHDFAFGRAVVLSEGLWGVINTDGKFVVPPIYAGIDDSDESHHYLVQRWIGPDTKKDMVIDEQYVHEPNAKQIAVPRELIGVLVRDVRGLPQVFSGLDKITPEQKEKLGDAFGLINAGKFDDAVKSLKELDEQKVTAAAILLGRIYQIGMGVKANPDLGRAFYMVPAFDEDGFALFENAQWSRTQKDERNYDHMLDYARRSVEAGYAPANRLLAAMLLEGSGMDVDALAAWHCIVLACKAHDPDAEFAAGICLESGMGPVQKSAQRAAEAYELAGKHGIANGYYRAGLLYESLENAHKAIACYRGAGADHVDAATHLAELLKRHAATEPSSPPADAP